MKKKKDPKLQETFSQLSRRDAMTALGSLITGGYILRNPYSMLMDTIVPSIIASAQASGSEKISIYANAAGAPNFNSFSSYAYEGLAAAGFIPNAANKNYIPGDTYNAVTEDATYHLEPILLNGNITRHMPPLWNSILPDSGTGGMPAKDLLNQSCFMHFRALADRAHRKGVGEVMRPVPGKDSVHGIHAGKNDGSIPCVGLPYGKWDQDGYFSSNSVGIAGLPQYIFGPGTPPQASSESLLRLMQPIQHTDPTVIANLPKMLTMDQYVENAIRKIGEYIKLRQLNSPALYDSYDKAKQLLRTAFGDIASQYDALLQKYNNIQRRCAEPLMGVIPSNTVSINGETYDPVNGISFTGLPEAFAICEYLIKVVGVKNVIMGHPGDYPGYVSICNGIAQQNDEHVADNRQKSLIVFSFIRRVQLAFIAELKRSLGSTWNQTVFALTQEFDRMYRQGPGTMGSDHLTMANTLAMFGGCFDRNIVIGNNTRNGLPAGRYQGTNGHIRPTQTGVQQAPLLISVEHATSTYCQILGIPSPVSRPSLVNINGGVIRSNAEEPSVG